MLTRKSSSKKRFGFADPKITESFDPERTLVEVELNAEKEDVGQNVGQKRSYVGQKAGQNRSCVGQKAGQNVGQKSLLSRPSAAEVPGGLPASARQVLSALREDSTLTHRGLAVKLGFAETTIDRAFSLLIRRGLVRRVGPKRPNRGAVRRLRFRQDKRVAEGVFGLHQETSRFAAA